MWLIIISLAMLVCIACMVYLITRLHRFSLMGRFYESYGKRKGTLLSIAVIAVLAALFVVLMRFMNAVIVFINLAIIWIICDILFSLISKIRKKKFKRYYAGIFAILFTAGYLSFGFYEAFHVVQTEYELQSGKSELKIAVLSDAHVGNTMDGDGFAGYMERINREKPDLVLIPGDLIDDATGKEDMIKTMRALGNLQTTYGVFYTFGNHDKGMGNSSNRGYTVDEFVNEMKSNGVIVLEDEVYNIGDDYCIVGRCDKSSRNRAEIKELMSEVEPGRYSIVMDHQPSDYNNEAEANCNLVVSGHTHGGQLVPITYVGEWIGVNDATYGMEKRGNTDFIVTSGIGDWEILFKTGCKSEYVIINIEE